MRRAATEMPANEGAGRTGGTGWLSGAAHPDAQPRREERALPPLPERLGGSISLVRVRSGWAKSLIVSGISEWTQTLLLLLRWPIGHSDAAS